MIPQGLPNQFLNWKLVPKWNEKKQRHEDTKVPCTPDGSAVDAHNKAYWTTYEQAAANGLGVAFVFDEDDDWFFLDLDKCGDVETGQWSAEATAIYQSFTGAWGEVSQSGKGLHIMGRCDKSVLYDRKNKWDGWLEFYIQKRFIAFGGNDWHVIGGGEFTNVNWSQQLRTLVPEREIMGELSTTVDPTFTGKYDDDELIAKLCASTNMKSQFGNGATAKDLWDANLDVLSKVYLSDDSDDFDASKADMALMCLLAYWTGKDIPRMDRIFRRSALLRDKYENRADYRKWTLEKACMLTKKVYDVLPKEDRPASQDNPLNKEVFLSINEMVEYFKGCIYIRDLHRVFVPDGSMLKSEQFNAVYGGHWFQMLPDNTKPTKNAFEALTQNSCYDFPHAISTCFRPDLPPSTIVGDKVNVYVDPQVAVVQGDPSPVWELMCKQIPNERDRLILLYYMAAVVQYPGVKFQWCPVLQGCEGNGKTLLARCVAEAIGERYVHSPIPENLGEKYNGYIEDKMFIIVEEIWMKGRMEVLNMLKPLITNENVEVRTMGVDKRMIKNVTNWFMCTNHIDGVIKSRNDRRYSIFFTAQQEEADLIRDHMDGEYFPNLYHWLKTGGYAVITHWLKTLPIPDEFNPATSCHRAPKTSSTDRAIAASLGPIEQEIIEAAESGVIGFKGDWVSSYSLSQLLRDKHIKIAKSKIGMILTEMGYKHWGRAPKPILHQDKLRPSLWYKGEIENKTFADFMTAQGWRA